MQKNGFAKLLKIVKIIFGSILLCTIFLIIFACSYVFNLKDWQAFNPGQVGQPSQSLTIYDKNGSIVTSLHATQDRTDVTIKELPDYVVKAFLAAEDERYYDHSGVDVKRIFGALFQDVKNGFFKEGASTITQQLVKQMFLKSDQTVSRKVQEALMAIKMENKYTKDQILEMYLNYVYFGDGAYGIQAAAKTYFGVDAKSLSLPQAATLAGILKSPTNYAPHIDPDKCLFRRDTVLNNMYTYGNISADQLSEAKATTLSIVKDQVDAYPYGFYLDTVQDDAQQILGLDSTELLSGGYNIYTSLDPDMQSYAQQVYQSAANFPPNASDGTQVQSAMVILDNQTGNVLSVIGGREHTGMRVFNRATNANRQPGSSIKPLIVYAPAIENFSYTASTFLLDQQESFSGFTPSDAGNTYHGWVTLRDALAHSYNLPAIKVLNTIGVKNGMDYCQRVGIPFSDLDQGLTLALGGLTNGVTPLEMAGAYLPFSNGGMRTVPSCIQKITDRNGNVVYQNAQKKYSVLTPETAYIMTSIMESGVAEGTSNKLQLPGIQIAAKTGTSTWNNSDYNKDSWIVAYTSEYTICCWMGFDTTNNTHVLSPQDTGGNYPALVAKSMFQHIYANRQPAEFTKPDDVVACTLDKVALETYHNTLLADASTPQDQTVVEYYKQGSQPTQVSSRFEVPSPPTDFHIDTSGDYPLLSFTAPNTNATYLIYRKDKSGEASVVYQTDGSQGLITFTDKSVHAGQTYEYYIIAQNKYVESPGQYVQSNPTQSIKYKQKAEISQ
jgi:penicillin-binding protein 1A